MSITTSRDPCNYQLIASNSTGALCTSSLKIKWIQAPCHRIVCSINCTMYGAALVTCKLQSAHIIGKWWAWFAVCYGPLNDVETWNCGKRSSFIYYLNCYELTCGLTRSAKHVHSFFRTMTCLMNGFLINKNHATSFRHSGAWYSTMHITCKVGNHDFKLLTTTIWRPFLTKTFRAILPHCQAWWGLRSGKTCTVYY